MLTLALVLGIYGLVQSLRPRRVFTSREREAFERIKAVREELKEIDKIVGPPKPPEPDCTMTLTVKNKPPEAPK
jgi:hypothetical protein